MGNLVCGGAMCQCSFGMTPSVFMVTPENQVTTGPAQMAAATIMDTVPMKNILPFGMCSSPANPAVAAATAAALGVLTPMPCVPVPAGIWSPGNAGVQIHGKTALTGDSCLNCAYGGMIRIIQPGCMTIIV